MGIKYSIIIPTLNEEYFLEKILLHLKSFDRDFEIIISDGGSSDNTLRIAKQHNTKIVKSEKGRGTQLNKGAECANTDVYLFLHADTFLPDNAFDLLDKFFENAENQICRFLLGFDFKHKLLDFYSAFSKFNTQFTRYGDSVIIIRKTLYEKLNGFDHRETFEDVDFLKRASAMTEVTVLNSSVESSARRFIKDGVIRRQLFNILLFTGYIFNFSEKTLSKMYNNTISKTKTDSLIIFLRYPKIGKVKTRLAKTTSSEFALRFYKSCAENLINNVKKIPKVNRFVFYSNKNEKDEITNWLGGKLFFAHQEGDDLGSRMKNAFEKVFTTGAKKVIIVGTDIPDLSNDIILKAFEYLDRNEFVIGPSRDGGYYLLGMKKSYPILFEDIEFSTSSVYAKTIKKINELKLNFHILPELQDIDTETDLQQWLNSSSVNSIKDSIKLSYETT